MAIVDARGFSCPVPLLMVQEEIKKTDPAELEVLIDAPCASRFWPAPAMATVPLPSWG